MILYRTLRTHIIPRLHYRSLADIIFIAMSRRLSFAITTLLRTENL